MSDELMLVIDGRDDPRHAEGSHIVTHRTAVGKLQSDVGRLQQALLDNELVRAWLMSNKILEAVRFLDWSERRALPVVQEEE